MGTEKEEARAVRQVARSGMSFQSGDVLRGGRYEIERLLGPGLDKAVYLAHDRMLGCPSQNDAASRAAGQRGDRDVPAHCSRSCAEIRRLVKRADFGLIGEENVDMPVDQIAERWPVPPHAKRVG